MQDPDLEIRGARSGGGGGVVLGKGGHPDPYIRGAQSPKKVFLALRASVWSKIKTRGGRTP